MYIQTKVLSKLLQSSFQVNMGLVCYLHLCSQRNIVAHKELVDVLSQCDNSISNNASLQHITNHGVSCHLACQVLCLTLWIWSTLQFTNSRTIVHVAMCVLAEITGTELHEETSVNIYTEKLCVPCVYLSHHTGDKLYPSIAEQGYLACAFHPLAMDIELPINISHFVNEAIWVGIGNSTYSTSRRFSCPYDNCWEVTRGM